MISDEEHKNKKAIVPFQLMKAMENLSLKRKMVEDECQQLRAVRRKVLVEEIKEGGDHNKQIIKKSRIKIGKGPEKKKKKYKAVQRDGNLFEINVSYKQDLELGCGGFPVKATRES